MYRLVAKIEIEGKGASASKSAAGGLKKALASGAGSAAADDSKKWIFEKITSVEITRDVDKLTDTCVIELPGKIKWKGESEHPLRIDDKVSVWLGYDDKLYLAFRGYIKTVGINNPLKITCEDQMRVIKTLPTVKSTFEAATVKEVVEAQQIKDAEVNVLDDIELGLYRVQADTVGALFEDLKKYNVLSFIKMVDNKPVIFCGTLFPDDGKPRCKFVTDGRANVTDSSGLGTQRAEDIKCMVRVISEVRQNDKRFDPVVAGEAGGIVREKVVHGKTQAEAKVIAEKELKLLQRFKRDGLNGSFTTFGFELLDKLDNVEIVSKGKSQGVYQIKKNVIKYGDKGYRQTVTIGLRVDK